jgi:hypothetical protein
MQIHYDKTGRLTVALTKRESKILQEARRLADQMAAVLDLRHAVAGSEACEAIATLCKLAGVPDTTVPRHDLDGQSPLPLTLDSTSNQELAT